VTSTFKTPGPLYGKVKQITEISATGNSRVLARLSYDENGLLIRKVDVDGFTTTMEYNSDGHVTKKSVLPPSDPAILRQLGVIEESLVKEVAAAKGVEERDGAYFDLGMFYIYRLGDLSRALGLTKSISDKEVAADILIQVVVGNRNLSESEKLARLRALAIDYPEKQYSLSKAISLYDGAN
jgi:YD repeat-containing protein